MQRSKLVFVAAMSDGEVGEVLFVLKVAPVVILIESLLQRCLKVLSILFIAQ